MIPLEKSVYFKLEVKEDYNKKTLCLSVLLFSDYSKTNTPVNQRAVSFLAQFDAKICVYYCVRFAY